MQNVYILYPEVRECGLDPDSKSINNNKDVAKHVMHIIEIKYKGKLQHFKFGEREVGHSASRPRALFTCHIRLM